MYPCSLPIYAYQDTLDKSNKAANACRDAAKLEEEPVDPATITTKDLPLEAANERVPFQTVVYEGALGS